MGAVAFASSVAKYLVFTNLFPGPIPQVSVYHHPSKSGDGQTASKESSVLLNQDMSLASGTHQQGTILHQSPVNKPNHDLLQTTVQVCLL